LTVRPIPIPPLRERPDDIPPLVQHFAARQATRLGRSVQFDVGAVQLLASYRWPGNVRELANIMERLAILAGGDVVTADDVARIVPGGGAPRSAAPSESWSDVALAGAVDDFEGTLIARALSAEARRRYNPATTTRLVGRSRLPRGNEWRGDVAVRNGTVVVAGRVDGTLLVINGDAILDSGAVVTGDVFVVGGTVARSPGATVGGDVRVYTAPLAYCTKGEDLALAPPPLRRWFRRWGIEKSWGTAVLRSSLTLA